MIHRLELRETGQAQASSAALPVDVLFDEADG
jgi:hypothetical protein